MKKIKSSGDYTPVPQSRDSNLVRDGRGGGGVRAKRFLLKCPRPQAKVTGANSLSDFEVSKQNVDIWAQIWGGGPCFCETNYRS